MKARHRLSFLFLAVPVGLIGCQEAATPKSKEAVSGPAAVQPASNEKDQEAAIHDALAQLSPEDRPLAEAQKYCAVMNKSRLGSMGKPVKVVVNDQPVFLCCKGCQKKAQADPDKTLAKAKELREKTEESSAQ
jgi:hypothetical protein